MITPLTECGRRSPALRAPGPSSSLSEVFENFARISTKLHEDSSVEVEASLSRRPRRLGIAARAESPNINSLYITLN